MGNLQEIQGMHAHIRKGGANEWTGCFNMVHRIKINLFFIVLLALCMVPSTDCFRPFTF